MKKRVLIIILLIIVLLSIIIIFSQKQANISGKATLSTGYPLRMPAKFEPLERIIIQDRGSATLNYPLIKEVTEVAEVLIIVDNVDDKNWIINKYQQQNINLNKVDFLIKKVDSFWSGDYCPWQIFYTNGNAELIDFTYNVLSRPRDSQVPVAYSNKYNMPLFNLGLVHTGGNIVYDGQGVMLSNDRLLRENPGLSLNEIKAKMNNNLGVDRLHIRQDLTGLNHEHIVSSIRFLAPDKLLIIKVNPNHPKYQGYENEVNYWRNQVSSYGTPYQIYRLYTNNEHPAINFIIVNNKVFVPLDRSGYDAGVLATFRNAMPGYEIIGIYDITPNPSALGSLHCQTWTIPDSKMLYIEHLPLTDSEATENGFFVKARVIPYSKQDITRNPRIYWKAGNGNWNSVSMQGQGNYNYQAYIPGQPSGTPINYYINAEDHSGRNENHPYIGEADPHSFTSLGMDIPSCTGFTYSDWTPEICPNTGLQTRTVISSSPSNCEGGNPVLTQACVYIPDCTENDWEFNITPISCPSNGTQIKTWTKIGNCEQGVSKPDSEEISCNPAIITCVNFTYTGWSDCRGGIRTRNVSSSLPSGCQGGNPIISDSCAPPIVEPEDDEDDDEDSDEDSGDGGEGDDEVVYIYVNGTRIAQNASENQTEFYKEEKKPSETGTIRLSEESGPIKRFFIKLWCKITNLFNNRNYKSCVEIKLS